ncbi:MAG: DUF4177 domain-containing protein [Kiloniellales bacterium]
MTTGPVQWEYKTVKLRLRGLLGGKIDQDELDGILNQAGREGWELVTVFATALYQGRTQDAAMVFKRRRVTTV